jgi:hypothetical protein
MTALSVDQIRRLRLFNEKANDLDGSRFAMALYDQQSGVIVEGGLTGPAEAVFVGPDGDAIRAFVLTIRLFQQSVTGSRSGRWPRSTTQRASRRSSAVSSTRRGRL